MKYYYVHGFNATGKTSAKLLSEAIQEEVEILSWDFSKKFDENFSSMLDILNKIDDEIILIGKSMGGFYANALANKLLLPCALFNPVVSAKEVLKKFNVASDITNSYKVEIKEEVLPRLVVVGLKDEILDPNDAINKWKGKCSLKTVDSGHDIKNFEDYKDDIIHLSDPILY